MGLVPLVIVDLWCLLHIFVLECIRSDIRVMLVLVVCCVFDWLNFKFFPVTQVEPNETEARPSQTKAKPSEAK